MPPNRAEDEAPAAKKARGLQVALSIVALVVFIAGLFTLRWYFALSLAGR